MSNWKFYLVFVCVALFLSSNTFSAYWSYITLGTILLFAVVYLFKDLHEWAICDKVSSSSFFILLSKYKWAEFNSKMDLRDAIKWSMKIGLISRSEYLRYIKSIDETTHCLLMNGTWFRDSVKEIAFIAQFDNLTEIRFTLMPDNSAFKLTAKKQFEDNVAYLDKHFFAWKQFVGITLNDKDEVQITVFLTPENK